jgi:murein DD-endopeptidase MepM/ murein hydrolase activator NlpD
MIPGASVLFGLPRFVVTQAHAVDYRFPGADEHYGAYYPTSYMDEGGHDWACGGMYYGGHAGTDFGAGSWAGMDEGRNVVAAAEGVVIATNDGEWDRCQTADCGEANYVILEHADGRRTWYWHLKQWSVAVSPNQWVSCGQYLGQVGSSGLSDGPHLHFEVREPNGAVGDPYDGPCSAPPTYWIAQGDYGGLPGNTCPNVGTCAQVATLSCGQTLVSANNAGGATTTHSVYGCGPASSSGPEIAYAFSTPVGESVTLGLTGVGADLDLFLLGSAACDGSGAVTCSTNPDASEEWITFDAAAGATYTVVIDGWGGSVSGFSLTALCTGGGGGDTTPVTDTSTATATATTDGDTAGIDGYDGPVDLSEWTVTRGAACGCRSQDGAAHGALARLGSAALAGLVAWLRGRTAARRHR